MSYARSAVTRMTLDMSRLDLQRSETVTLGDTNRRWEVTLINGGAPFRLPPNWTAALTGIKPDGTGLLNGCSVADGKIVYDFAAGAEIATCVGSYPVHFDIWDEVGELVASPKVYVNVLADVRPHAELESNGQYTQIGELIGRVNQTDEDVDLLAKNVLAQGTDITALKDKITTAGTVTIPANEWTDTMPKLAYPEQPVIAKGTVALLMPGNTASQIAARKAKITIQSETYGGGKIVIQREDGEAPTGNITLDYIIIKVDNPEAPPKAALIGVDAYGEGGGTASGVDETAVKKIINSLLGNVANERQYSAKNPPPYPVTKINGQTGEVNLPIPSEAADVKADPAGTAETKTSALRQEVNTKLVDYDKSTSVNNKISSHNASTESHADLRMELQRLADRLNAALNSDDTSLDDIKEIVAYIKSNKTLIDGITSSKVNVTDIVNNLTTNTANVPLSAAQGVALKLLIDSLEEIVEGKTTNDQVADQIKTALSPYITRAVADKTYQPAGDYLTPTTGDQRYAKPSDIPTVPTKVSQLTNDSGYLTQHQSIDHLLPKNQGAANAGKLMMVADDGSVTYIEITDLGLSGGDVVGNIDSDKNIVLTGNLAPGTYTFAYLVRKSDGTTETVTIGTYTVEEETETKTYTITWVVDGKTTTETYEEGETPTFKGSTDKAADDEYTYTFAGWSPEIEAVKADATYTATYTQTAKPTEPTQPRNFANPAGSDWVNGTRLTTDINQTKPLTGGASTNYIAIQSGDTVTCSGINFEDSNNRIAIDGSYLSIGTASQVSTAWASSNLVSDVTYDSNSITLTITAKNDAENIRFSGLLTGTATDVVINIKRNGAWLTA